MSEEDLVEKRCNELRENFLRNASALPSLALSLKADLSKKSMSKKTKLDCCQFCGLKFDLNTIKSKLKSHGKGKKKTVKMIIYCEGCKSEAPGVNLPKSAALKKKGMNDDTVELKKKTKVEQRPQPSSTIKKSSSFPVLTHRQKQISRSNRLSKMVAAMEKPEPSKTTSTLDAFLSSLK
uniref:Uncharacterized protein n=1 Tax=Panagrolaimus davidi TaxID=227884 RepID=A0A914PSD7_9BILA